MKPTRSEAKRQFSDRNRDVLLNVQSHQWWSTDSVRFFARVLHCLQLVGGGDGLVCESVGVADQLSDHF